MITIHKQLLRNVFSALMAALVILPVSADSLSEHAQTEVEQGKLEGTRTAKLAMFKGIPFAAPPVDDLRWKAPQPAKNWQGVLETKDYSAACMQLENRFITIPNKTFSEDCLYLNVWTPAQAKDEKLPVLVWIHGGGFSFGSPSQPFFDGAELAKKGVVFVSPSYRVGPFGFLAHPALSAETDQGTSGNYGLLDQIAALQWVQDNIAAFGGDPSKVTIMGESAGAMSVGMLAASPLAKGLFRGVIAESGAAFGFSGGDDAMQNAEKLGESWAAKQGAHTAQELRNLASETILNTIPRQSVFVMESSWPIQDGYVITEDPRTLYTKGLQNDTPILIGWNGDEGGLFVNKSSLIEYQSFVKGRFGDHADEIFNAYPATNDAEALRMHKDVFRDLSFGWPGYHWANAQITTGQEDAYVFYFNHFPPAMGDRPSMGPAHAAELYYVMNNFLPFLKWREVDYKLGDLMSSYWINFVKTGNPNGQGLPTWPKWQQTTPQVMWFENDASVQPLANKPMIYAIDKFMQKNN